MNVTNNTRNPLVLPVAPGDTMEAIAPGATADVSNWDAIKGHATVQKYVEGKAITVGGKAQDEGKRTSVQDK